MDMRLGVPLLALLVLVGGCEIEVDGRTGSQTAESEQTVQSSGHAALETRTFALEHLTTAEAMALVGPYVYDDRTTAPGKISFGIARALSVRETPDNLDKIARMLEQFDVASDAPSYRLHFQVVAANGGESDVRLAPFEEALRKVFRFDGYSLVGEGYVTVSTGSFDLAINPGDAAAASGQPDDAAITLLGNHPGLYNIEGTIHHNGQLALDIVGPSIPLREQHWTMGGIETTLGFRPGQTLVLGSMPTPDQTVFIVLHVAEGETDEPA